MLKYSKKNSVYELFILLQRLYFQNQHYAQAYEKSNDHRKRFAIIFKAVTETTREELMIQKKDINLTELKQYGKGTSGGKFIKNNFNDLSETASNLAMWRAEIISPLLSMMLIAHFLSRPVLV